MLARMLSPLLLLLSFASLTLAQAPKELVVPSGLSSSAQYGSSVDMDGERAVIGARGFSQPGRCFVFEKARGWEDPIEISPDAGAGDGFGNAVSLDGDQLAIGSMWEGDHGAVYLYQRQGEDWVKEAVLYGADYFQEDFYQFDFGYDVALDGNHLVVASLTQTDFFERIAGKWRHRLSVPEATNVQTIRSCDVEGAIAVIGSIYSANRKGDLLGAVHIYQFDGRSWDRVQTLKATDSPGYSNFGLAVDLDGARLAVGARTALVAGETEGAVYLYARPNGSWVLEQKVVATNETPDSWFGHSVALSGDRLLVGAIHSELLGDYEPGAVHLFLRGNGAWMESQVFTDPEGYGIYDAFGESVAITHDLMIVATEPDRAAWLYQDVPMWRAVSFQFELVARILVGVSTGGGGIIIIPGQGPVPVDEYPPDPVLPVFTLIQHDKVTQKTTIQELLAKWPGHGFRVTRKVEDALRYPDQLVVLLTRQIGSDAKWIAENAEILKAQRGVPLVMFGLQDDPTCGVLADLIDKGVWE